MGICENNNKIKIKEEKSQEKNESIQKFYNEFESIKDENFNANLTFNTTFCGHPPIPINIIFESMKSVCKIAAVRGLAQGTGFFINISNLKNFLVTANHIFGSSEQNLADSEIEIQIYNNKKMKIKLNNREYHNLRSPTDIALIEIKDTDEIYNDVKFLYYDLNYEKEYEIYKDGYVFTIEYIKGDAACGSGQIIGIDKYRKYEFIHTIPTDKGSSGCPIILLNNSINIIRVIGIHTSKNIKLYHNYGTFIGEILNIDLFKEENIKISINSVKGIEDDNNIIIKFLSIDQLINVPISCNITDSFSTVESKLFIEFPDLKNKNIFFLANGDVIDRKATLEQNKIKVPTSILIYIND